MVKWTNGEIKINYDWNEKINYDWNKKSRVNWLVASGSKIDSSKFYLKKNDLTINVWLNYFQILIENFKKYTAMKYEDLNILDIGSGSGKFYWET